jgi:putative nucleotidyltransferase with HDIG domain
MSTAQQAAFEFVKTLAAELSHREFQIPPFPDTAIRIRDALTRPNVTTEMVARIVKAEPVLTTRLLRMANSALMKRGPIEVTDLTAAINRLGFDLVRNTAVSMAMNSTFAAPKGSVLHRQIDDARTHCIHVSALAYILARRKGVSVRPDDAMLAGLLHDIGKLYILHRAHNFPELFEDMAQMNELLTTWHTGVGRAIVECWGFSGEIAEAVDEHEELRRDHFGSPDITDLVQVANLVVNLQHASEEALQEIDAIPACKKLGIDHAAIKAILEKSGEELHSMEQALGG